MVRTLLALGVVAFLASSVFAGQLFVADFNDPNQGVVGHAATVGGGAFCGGYGSGTGVTLTGVTDRVNPLTGNTITRVWGQPLSHADGDYGWGWNASSDIAADPNLVLFVRRVVVNDVFGSGNMGASLANCDFYTSGPGNWPPGGNGAWFPQSDGLARNDTSLPEMRQVMYTAAGSFASNSSFESYLVNNAACATDAEKQAVLSQPVVMIFALRNQSSTNITMENIGVAGSSKKWFTPPAGLTIESLGALRPTPHSYYHTFLANGLVLSTESGGDPNKAVVGDAYFEVGQTQSTDVNFDYYTDGSDFNIVCDNLWTGGDNTVANGPANSMAKGDVNDDGYTDGSDFNAVCDALWTGPYDAIPGNNVPSLRYDAATGNMYLNTDGISVYSLMIKASQAATWKWVGAPFTATNCRYYNGSQQWVDNTQVGINTNGTELLIATFPLSTTFNVAWTGHTGMQVQYNYAGGTTSYTNITVPEPATLCLLGLGGLGALLRRRVH